MHKVWRDLARVDLSYYQEHLWVQLALKDKGDVNIMGTGSFKVYTMESGKLVSHESLQMSVDAPSKVVCYQQDIPALTTIKVFDASGGMLFHLVSGEPVEIR